MDPGQERIARVRRWFFLAAYLTAVVLATLYWSTDLLSHDRNRVENELAQNGLSSFVRAALTNEIDYRANYKSEESKENFTLVARELDAAAACSRGYRRSGSTARFLRARGSGA